ncbi:sulfotransferase [Gemmatimonadota bacterium]
MAEAGAKTDPGMPAQPKICFILGIQQRSGTNFLYRLLDLHPRCVGPGPIWEDYLLDQSDLLCEYARRLYARETYKKWNVKEELGPPAELLRRLGDGLCDFLRLQMPSGEGTGGGVDGTAPKYLLTKTPSIVNLDNFFGLFPDSPLLIIVRDGRAVVESGVRSFNWRYETAMQSWAASARAILDFQRESCGSGRSFRVIRYEELFQDTEHVLREVFSDLRLEAGQYDFEAARSLSVTGSSETRAGQNDRVHWNPVERSGGFNPLARAERWGPRRHARFNWVAGKQMTQLGYELHPAGAVATDHPARNRILDAIWSVRRVASLARDRYRKVRAP